jgi:hypothetical protein
VSEPTPEKLRGTTPVQAGIPPDLLFTGTVVVLDPPFQLYWNALAPAAAIVNDPEAVSHGYRVP